MKDLRMYILINKEIEISKGKLAGQVGHAVATYLYEAGMHGTEEQKELVESYMQGDQKKILLQSSLKKLEMLEREFIGIRDKGYTELAPETLTCVNVGIIEKDDAPGWLRRMRLY